MLDNNSIEIRLTIAGFEINTWDEASIDHALATPAGAWSLSLFREEELSLPTAVQAGASIQLYYGKELILTSIADSVCEGCDRAGGYGLQIAGRDLAGQLIDCSVPIFNGRQVNLGELINRYVLGGDLAAIIKKTRIQNNSWLKNKISVEPGESLWDAITKAAAMTGQHVWFEPDGTLVIGDPFVQPYAVQDTLRLMKYDNSNNILNAKYEENISDAYSEIKILSQDSKAQNILSSASIKTQYPFKRLKVLTLGDVETKAEADTALKKIEKDNNLQTYSLNLNVSGWTIDEKVWSIASLVNLETNMLNRATAKWAVMSRTLTLSRGNGMMTSLKLNRQGDWAQPMVHKEKKTATKKSKAKTAKAKDDKND